MQMFNKNVTSVENENNWIYKGSFGYKLFMVYGSWGPPGNPPKDNWLKTTALS